MWAILEFLSFLVEIVLNWRLIVSLVPAVICVRSATLTTSTGSASVGGNASGLAPSDQTLHSNTAACPIAEIV